MHPYCPQKKTCTVSQQSLLKVFQNYFAGTFPFPEAKKYPHPSHGTPRGNPILPNCCWQKFSPLPVLPSTKLLLWFLDQLVECVCGNLAMGQMLSPRLPPTPPWRTRWAPSWAWAEGSSSWSWPPRHPPPLPRPYSLHLPPPPPQCWTWGWRCSEGRWSVLRCRPAKKGVFLCFLCQSVVPLKKAARFVHQRICFLSTFYKKT